MLGFNDPNSIHRFLCMMTGQSRFTVQSKATDPKLFVAVYPSYVYPWSNSPELPRWLSELGLSHDFDDPEATVAVFHWNGTLDQLREMPPMLIRESTMLDLYNMITKEQWQEIMEMGHFAYYSDPSKEKLLEWLLQHRYIVAE
ncbi:MAG: hypothetical protein NUV80_06875 [Candidatus Berkelbacteria bacterium]|nr:hypothetical protein [Candidatus Berkelbacteria bacterium]MCR4308253.1 hypothetical protein [Candidatus Berkelbacteria bacterium]